MTITLPVFLTIISLVAAWFLSLAGVIIWAVRQEGRINVLAVRCKGLEERDGALQRQIEEYRSHTDTKIDKMGDDLKGELRRIFDILDRKADRVSAR